MLRITIERQFLHRNNLNKVLLTPITKQDEWIVDACYHSGTLFLEIFKTPQKDFPNCEHI